MNKDNIKLWISALRSGKYKQYYGGPSYIDGSMCAIAVGCHVKDKDVSFHEWVGLRPKTLLLDVIHWNDVDKLTFNQIADKIEEYMLNGP